MADDKPETKAVAPVDPAAVPEAQHGECYDQALADATRTEYMPTQPAEVVDVEFVVEGPPLPPRPDQPPHRQRLADERKSLTHHFTIGNLDGYVTVGFYEDGQPGEVFVKMGKEGGTLSGMLDAWAIGLSITLQYGVPLEVFVTKMSGMAFEPSGFSGTPELGYAKSVVDYVIRWMGLRFGSASARASIPPGNPPRCPRCGSVQERDDHGIFCPSCGQGGKRT